MRTKGWLYCIAVGGIAFWLPAVVLSAIFRGRAGPLMLSVASLTVLFALALLDWFRFGRSLRWNWALAGVYVLGPTAILTASVFSRGALPFPSGPGSWILVLLCLFPPVTLWFSLLNGMILSVLAATLALPVLAIFRWAHSGVRCPSP
jgi:hypothetical protein